MSSNTMSHDKCPEVPMTLYKKNRKRLCKVLKDSYDVPRGTLILLKGGERKYRNSSDTERLFRQDSYFHWAFGVKEPGFFGIVDVDSSRCTLLAPPVPEDYFIWMGKPPSNEKYQEMYDVDEVLCNDEIAEILSSKKPPLLLTLAATEPKPHLDVPVVFFEGLKAFEVDNVILRRAMDNCRAIKTKEEIDVIRYACQISCQGQLEVMRRMRPGMKEYQLESMFQHYAYAHGGCRYQSYILTVSSGSNSSIMCYGNARLPNNKTIEENNICLVDCGFEYHCYTSDVTCCFPANGRFSERQKVVYNTTLAAQKCALAQVKPGVSWITLHLLACRTILTEFKKYELLIGDVDDMVAAAVYSLFMPFGVGHFVGLDLLDVSEYPKEKSKEPGLKCLESTCKLKEGMVLTIEPFVCFIKPVLEDAYQDPRYQNFLNKDVIDQYMDFGGIRIEDCVAVTADGYELLTEIPRDVKDIENIMAEGREQQLKPIL